MLTKISHFIETSTKSVLVLSVLVSVATTVAVIAILGEEALGFFNQVPLVDFLFGSRWEPMLEPKSFGVLPLVAGTFIIVAGSLLISVPFGLLIGIYLNEFATPRVCAVLKPVLEILAGIPTVVYGFFAITFITPMLRTVFSGVEVFNALSGFIVVAIMIIPMISSMCDDALRAVPSSIKQGAYALGATKYEVLTQIAFPAARSSIGASIVLAGSRAIGETMAVTLAAGATPNLTLNPAESIQTMTAYIVQVSLGDTPAGGIEYMTCFAVAALLFVATFGLNILGNRLIHQKALS